MIVAVASIASVSSGNSSYSCGCMTCASTRARSEPTDRREPRLFACICLPHTEDVACRATRSVPDDHHASVQHAVTEHTTFTIRCAQIVNFHRWTIEDEARLFEVQAALGQGLIALCLVVRYGIQYRSYTNLVARAPRASTVPQETEVRSVYRSSHRPVTQFLLVGSKGCLALLLAVVSALHWHNVRSFGTPKISRGNTLRPRPRRPAEKIVKGCSSGVCRARLSAEGSCI